MSELELSTPLFWASEYVALGPSNGKLIGYLDDKPTIYKGDSNFEWQYLIAILDEEMSISSPPSASFGGFFPFSPSEQVIDVEKAITALPALFPNAEVVSIVYPPDYFYPDIFSPQIADLLSCGFQCDLIDVCFYIDISSWSISSLSKGNRKKLRQQKELGASFSPVGLGSLETIYQLIYTNRKMKGVNPSMTLDQVRRAFLALPTNYELYELRLNSVLIAGAVTVRISDDSLYVLYWADNFDYRTLSPIVGMCEGLVDICAERGIRTLDLGGTYAQGVFNEGLGLFKSNLGALPSNKCSVSGPLIRP